MLLRHFVFPALGLTASVALCLTTVRAENKTDRSDARAAITKAIDFMQKDTVRWRAERQCATCHHGTMTVFALTEARRQGYDIDRPLLDETIAWTKGRLGDPFAPRDPRPGWAMINTMALYLSVMAQNQPGQETLTASELKGISVHTANRLEADGSGLTPATMEPPRPINGPPPTWESRETFTLLAALAMQPGAQSHEKVYGPAEDGRKRSVAYLDGVTRGKDNQAHALRLLLNLQEKMPKKAVRTDIDRILARQNPDGGWSQIAGLPSDAYATGQTLYVLNVAGVEPKRKEVRRAVDFLRQTQMENGSWPMTRRAHPGVTPGPFKEPIVFFGSAWATIGLVRSNPLKD